MPAERLFDPAPVRCGKFSIREHSVVSYMDLFKFELP